MKHFFLRSISVILFLSAILLTATPIPVAVGQLLIPLELPGASVKSPGKGDLPPTIFDNDDEYEDEYEETDFDSVPHGEIVLHDISFLPVIPGRFTMGNTQGYSEAPKDESHTITVAIGNFFYLSKYEITQDQWTRIMGINPSRYPIGRDHPVENVSWQDCQEFLKKLNSMSDGEMFFRLPTESEWEYVCRAGEDFNFSLGNSTADLEKTAWYEDNSQEVHQPVGKKQPNDWGFYDMLGNVYEWCQDSYAESYENHQRTEKAWQRPNEYGTHVRRGGSFAQPAKNCRVSFRGSGKADNRREDVGLRLVAEFRE